jgi:hypothetical protein
LSRIARIFPVGRIAYVNFANERYKKQMSLLFLEERLVKKAMRASLLVKKKKC